MKNKIFLSLAALVTMGTLFGCSQNSNTTNTTS